MKNTIRQFNSYEELVKINNEVVEKGYSGIFSDKSFINYESVNENLKSAIEQTLEKGIDLFYVINEDGDCIISGLDWHKKDWLDAGFKEIF